MSSDIIKRITPSATLEITARARSLKREGVDVVNFAAGEPDFDTPQPIKQAAITAINAGFTKYTPATGIPELKEAIAKKLQIENNLSYRASEIVVTCGAKHALYNIFQVLCSQGDEVLVPSPYWLSYPEIVKLAGAAPVLVEADRKTFAVKPEDIERKITKKTIAMIVNSPANPTGVVYSRNLLKEIARIAVERGIYVISDEIYENLVYDGMKHVSIASLNKKIFDLTFVVNGVSKSFAMTGWRIGYLAGKQETIKGISSLQSHSTSNPSSISQAAALAAIEAGFKRISHMRTEFEKRRDIMAQGLNKITGISCHKPSGAFYCFADVSGTGMDGLTFARTLLREKHVAVIPGGPFGREDCVRFSFATSSPDIERGLQRVNEWLKR